MNAKTAHLWPTGAEREFLLWISIVYPDPSFAMKRKSAPKFTEPSESEIQHAAYLMWVEEGRPEGRDREHWLAARELLVHRHGRDAKTQRRASEVAASAGIY